MVKTTKRKNCNCRKKEECPLEGKCRSKGIIYKCVVTAKLIHEKFTEVQQKVTLSNDIRITKSHLKIKNLHMRHPYQNKFGNWKIDTIPPQI